MRKSTSNVSTVLVLCTVGLLPSLPASGQQGPEDIGEWGALIDDWNFTAIHMILLKTRKVLCLAEATAYAVYDLNTGDFIMIDGPDKPGTNPPLPLELHCSGHAQSGNGSVVFVGGSPEGGYTFAYEHTVMFDPDAYDTTCTQDSHCSAFNGSCNTTRGYCDPWTFMDDMPEISDDVSGKRWYPTCTTLGDGRIMVLGGCPDDGPHTADVPLIFDATQPTGQQYTQLPAAAFHLPYYPFNFLLSDGNLFYAGYDSDNASGSGNSRLSQTLDPALEQWNIVDTNPVHNGSMAMIGPDLVMRAGGGPAAALSSAVYTIDPTVPTPQ